MKHIKSVSIALFTLLISGNFLTTNILAQDETSEPTIIEISKDGSEQIQATSKNKEGAQAILQNLERLASDEANKETIISNYEDIGEKRRGFIAQVTSTKDESLRIQSRSGEEFFLAPDQSTTVVRKTEIVTADKIKLSEWFTVDDWLVVIGVEDDGVFLPRRIMISSVSLEPEEQFVERGLVRTLQKTKLELTPSGSDQALSFVVDASTSFQNVDGSDLTLNDFSKEDQVIVVATGSETKKTARIVRSLSYVEAKK